MTHEETLPKRERIDILYRRLQNLLANSGSFTPGERKDEIEDCRRALDQALIGESVQ